MLDRVLAQFADHQRKAGGRRRRNLTEAAVTYGVDLSARGRDIPDVSQQTVGDVVELDGPGKWIVLAGQTGGDEKGEYASDMAAQVGTALKRIMKLLAEAGATGMTLNFAYPSEVTRPYMPNPQKLYDAMKTDLEAAGIVVNTATKPWNGGYLDDASAGNYDAWLLGWTGDYNAADNFHGSIFSNYETNDCQASDYPWGKTLSQDLKKADANVDTAAREAAYKTINKQIAEEYLPGLPISSSAR